MHQYVGKLFSIDLLQAIPQLQSVVDSNYKFQYAFIYTQDESSRCVFIVCYYNERNNKYNTDICSVSNTKLREIDLDKYVINSYSKSNFTWGR